MAQTRPQPGAWQGEAVAQDRKAPMGTRRQTLMKTLTALAGSSGATAGLGGLGGVAARTNNGKPNRPRETKASVIVLRGNDVNGSDGIRHQAVPDRE